MKILITIASKLDIEQHPKSGRLYQKLLKESPVPGLNPMRLPKLSKAQKAKAIKDWKTAVERTHGGSFAIQYVGLFDRDSTKLGLKAQVKYTKALLGELYFKDHSSQKAYTGTVV